MQAYKASAAMLTVLVLFAAAAVWNTAEAASSSDVSAIKALMQSYSRAVDARSVDGIMAVYAPGSDLFVFDAVPPRAYRSAEAYRKDWQGILQAFPGPAHDVVQQLNVTAVGPIAYGHHVQDVHLTRKDGSVWHVVLRVTDVYRRTAGQWRIVQEHVSWPVDPATGKADFLSHE
jgi:ketosteroid isomerase-like protein